MTEKNKLSNHRIALTVAYFLAMIHIVWSLAVWVAPYKLQAFVLWILALHHVSMPFTTIKLFNPLNALMLICMTFIFGYFYGWIFAVAHNILHRK